MKKQKTAKLEIDGAENTRRFLWSYYLPIPG